MLRMRTLAGLASFSVLALVLVAVLAPTAGATGPWVQSDNGYYATARFGTFSSSELYDAEGDVLDAGDAFKYRERSILFDAEYGMSNKMTFLLAMPVLWKTYTLDADPDTYNNTGFGDLKFGLKYGFLDPLKDLALALELSANTPTGYNSQGIGVPSMGRGRFSALAALHGGMTFDALPLYVQGQLGYRMYTAKGNIPPSTEKSSIVSNELVYALEAGFFITPRFLLVGEYLAANANDTDKPDYQSQSRVGGNVQYRLKPGLDVLVGVRSSVSGKNSPNEKAPVYKGTEIRVGVALKRNDLGPHKGQGSSGYEEGAFPDTAPKLGPAPATVPDPVPVPAPAPSDTTGTPK
jgi:hypothetical protein